MVKGMKCVGFFFLVGICGVNVDGDPTYSLAYIPTEDGCYSHPALIEYESVTLNGKTFNRAVTASRCMDEGTTSNAESFGDCLQQTIDGEYNSFCYDESNDECSMHLFWVPKDNPLFSFDNPANEYYTKEDSTSGSSGSTLAVAAWEEKVVYVSEEMNTQDAANDKLNPLVKPFIEDFDYDISTKYEEINATVTLGGTLCLASIYLFENDAVLDPTPPDSSVEFESPEVVKIYRKASDAEAGCSTGDIFVFMDVPGTNDAIFPSAPVSNMAEDKKNYIRSMESLSAIQASIKWQSDASNSQTVYGILSLSGDTTLVSKVSATYTGEAVQEITTIEPEMLTSHTQDDGDCSSLGVTVEITDAYECPAGTETVFMREELLGSLASDTATGTAFDACSVFGYKLQQTKDFIDAESFCSANNLFLPIVKSSDASAAFAEQAEAEEVWLGLVGDPYAWQDDNSTDLDATLFIYLSSFTQLGNECASGSYDMSGKSIYPRSGSCTVERVAICWKNVETITIGG